MNIRTSLSGTVNYYDDSFYKSDDFLYIYMEELKDASHNLIYNNKSEQYSRVKDGDMEIIYQMSNASYYKIEQYYYLIIYKNLAFTNVELTEQTKTIDEIKLFISENDFEHILRYCRLGLTKFYLSSDNCPLLSIANVLTIIGLCKYINI